MTALALLNGHSKPTRRPCGTCTSTMPLGRSWAAAVGIRLPNFIELLRRIAHPWLCGPPGVAGRWRGCSSVAKPSDKNLKREIPTGARYPPSPVGGNEHQIGDGSGAAAAAAAVALGPCSSPLAKEWDVFTHST